MPPPPKFGQNLLIFILPGSPVASVGKNSLFFPHVEGYSEHA